jgi:tetratricopeptide (TPR) repeat protein
MLKWCLFMAAAVAVSLGAATPDAATKARAISKEAYETIYQHPFEGAILQQAQKHLDQAHTLNEKEPYVWLGAAELTLAGGFHSGDFLDAQNYERGVVDQALTLAQRGVQLDDKLADAPVVAGKIFLALGRLTDAQRELDRARALEPAAFKPLFYQAVWYKKQGDWTKFQEGLRSAGAVAKGDWDQRSLLYQLEAIAEERGDDAQHEKIHKALINLDPKRPWPHGNYGWFLLDRQRYDESIAEFEKAVALMPYPNALQGLEQARRQRDTARGRR